MPISDQHRDDVFRTLTILREGFLELGELDGAPCVPMEGTARIVLPDGTGSLFLRLGVPALALGDGALMVHFFGGEAECLLEIEIDSEDTWVALPTRGATAIRIETARTWNGGLVGLASSSELGLLIKDAEILTDVMRPRYDLVSSDADGRRFLSLRLDLTNKCNLRCRMCPLSFDEIFYQSKNYVEVAEFRKFAADILPRTEQLSLSVAYEPLLHPAFPEILAVVRSYGVPFVEFTTNGTLLDEALMNAFIDGGVSRVTFSVDGSCADTYEHIRRGADFEKFLRGLDVFARVRAERGASKPELSFNMVLMKKNIDELESVIRMGADRGLDVMHSCLLIPHVGLEMEQESLQHDRLRANRSLAGGRRAAQELGIRASFPEDFNLDLPDEPVESLPTTPEYTLAEDWGKDRKRAYTLTTRDEVGESDFEAEPPHSSVSEDDPADARVQDPATPGWRTLAPLPGPETLDGPLEPKVYGAMGGPTMVRSGHASAQAEARDGDGATVVTACIYPWNLAIVNPELQVVPCCNWCDYTTMGDLKTEGFDEIWNGDAYQRLRLELQTGRYRPCCEHCPERREI